MSKKKFHASTSCNSNNRGKTKEITISEYGLQENKQYQTDNKFIAHYCTHLENSIGL